MEWSSIKYIDNNVEKYYEITSIRPRNQDIVNLYKKVCKKLCNPKTCIPFAGVIVEHYEGLGQFILV